MDATLTCLAGATILLTVGLAIDRAFRSRWPLAVSALWNAVLVSALALPAAAWFLPRVELAVLPPVEQNAPAPDAVGPMPPLLSTPSDEVPASSGAGEPEIIAEERRDAAPITRTITLDSTAESPVAVERLDWPAVFRTVFAVVYSLGLSMMLLRFGWQVATAGKLRRSASPVDNLAWRERFEHWLRHIALRHTPALLVSADVDVPLVLGWWRPVIVIPAQLAEEHAARSIDAILVHELAHVVRADCGWQLVERLMQAIYWFHPLVWLAGRRIAAVRERACDDFAIHALADRHAYAETLLAVAARLAAGKRLLPRRSIGLAMAVVRTTRLEQRLAAIETSAGQNVAHLSPPIRGTIVALLLAILAATLAVRVVRAAPGPTATPPAAAKSESTGEPKLESPAFEDAHQLRRFWRKQLVAGDYAALAETFSPALTEQLPPAAFAERMSELTSRYGSLLNTDSDRSRRYGLSWFVVLELKFERANLELRMQVENRPPHVTSLWIAPPEGTAPPEGFDRVQFRFRVADETARANLSLSAKAVGADGQPASATFQFFAAVDADNPLLRDDHWVDPTATHWLAITSGRDTEDRLLPGKYRVTAQESRTPGDRFKDTPFGMSEIVELKEGQDPAEVIVRIEPGSTLVVRALEVDTGQSLDDVSLALKRAGQDFPPTWRAVPTKEERQPGIYTFDELPPGRYKLEGYKSAHSPTDVERKLTDEVFVEMQPDQNQELAVKFRTARLDEAAIAKHWPWIATGRVTDPAGKPIAGATVHAASGYATLLGSSSTTTDADGRYMLRFRQGIGMSDPVSLQVALIRTWKTGYFETNLNRQGNLMMALKAPSQEAAKHMGSPRFVFLPNEPQEVNFTLARGATLRIELVDVNDKAIEAARIGLAGKATSPGGSVMSSGETERGGNFTADNVPLGFEWWIWTSTNAPGAGKGLSARTLPFQLDRAGHYSAKLMLKHDAATDSDLLEFQSFTHDGQDVLPQVQRDDPLLRRPVSEEQAAEAREIMKKLQAANRAWWFQRPQETVESIRYEFVLPDNNRRSYTYEKAAERYDHWVAHGLSYSSATAMVCSAPQRLTFRMVEVEPTRIRIGYTVNGKLGYSAGNGVRGTWRGFVSGPVREGIITIDPRRWVPIKHTYGDDGEEFDDYLKLPDGTWAPRTVRVLQNGAPRFDWTFDVYEPGVWLFTRSANLDDLQGPAIATLENITINGQPATRLPR